jgi:phospholipase/lecithinase/hemolysin
MATQWLRRAWLLAAGASALLLAACGGGSVESSFTPTRIVAFGDAMADVGQNGTRYTVNDGSVNNWTQYVANVYGVGVAPASAGGSSYATGNARVAAEPDAGGSTATLTVREQVDAFLAAGGPRPGDLTIVNAGTSDLIVQARAVVEGRQTSDQMLVSLKQAARDLAGEVQRLVSGGANRVVVVGPVNLGRTPWGEQLAQQSLFEAATRAFNTELLVRLVDYGDSVLYVDAERQFNLYWSGYASYDLYEPQTPVCTSVDAGEGIGTGPGQVDSSECTTATLRAADYQRYLFADRVYPTPRGHQLFGDFAQARIRERW